MILLIALFTLGGMVFAVVSYVCFGEMNISKGNRKDKYKLLGYWFAALTGAFFMATLNAAELI